MERVKFATLGLTPTFSTVLRSTVGNVTAELVVVTATTVCSTSLGGSLHTFNRLRAQMTRTKTTMRINTPVRVVTRYFTADVITATPCSPVRDANRQKTPTGAMHITYWIMASTTA